MRKLHRFIAALIVWAALTALPATSQAGTNSFCTFWFNPGQSCNPNADHSYRSIAALGGGPQDAYWKCAGATLNNSSTPYGSYFCASSWSCHAYSGNNILRPKLLNGSTRQVITGRGAYGVDSFNGCSRGVAQPMSATSGAARVAALRKSLPAFERAGTGVAPPKELKRNFGIEAAVGGSVSFNTSRGKGWALIDSKSADVCLLVEDTAGYGFTCAKATTAQTEGVTASLARTGSSVQIALKPESDEVAVDVVTESQAMSGPVA